MNLEQLRDELEYQVTMPEPTGLVLYVLYDDENGENQIRIADIDSESANELKKQYLQYFSDKFIDNEDLILQNISEADNRKNTAYYYDLGERPLGLNIMTEIRNHPQKEQFSFNEVDLSNVTGFVIAIGTDERKVLLYKSHHHLSVISSQNVFGIRVSNHRFVRFTGEIIKLSANCDFIQINDSLIVISIKTLEKKFGFESIIRRKAVQNIDLIQQLSLIENIEVLQEMSLDLKHAKSIVKIKANSPVMQLPAITVVNFVRGHKPIMKKFRISEDGTRLRLDTKVSQKLFLKLMNDDFLTSELTRLYYEGIAKDPMNIEGDNLN